MTNTYIVYVSLIEDNTGNVTVYIELNTGEVIPYTQTKPNKKTAVIEAFGLFQKRIDALDALESIHKMGSNLRRG